MLPITALQKLYTMAFMPLAATTLAATIERFEKLSAARRVHDTNFQLVADSMLREQAVIQQSISPELSEEAFVLRVLKDQDRAELVKHDHIIQLVREFRHGPPLLPFTLAVMTEFVELITS